MFVCRCVVVHGQEDLFLVIRALGTERGFPRGSQGGFHEPGGHLGIGRDRDLFAGNLGLELRGEPGQVGKDRLNIGRLVQEGDEVQAEAFDLPGGLGVGRGDDQLQRRFGAGVEPEDCPGKSRA